MLKLKNLIATVLLSGVVVMSFAQSSGVPKNGGAHASATTYKHSGHAAKAKHLKTKAHAKKHHKVRHHVKKHHKKAVAHKA